MANTPFLLILVALVPTVLCQYTCPTNLTFVYEGQECDLDVGKICQLGLSCENYTCKFVHYQQNCTSNSNCSSSQYFPQCIRDKCDLYRYPGDPCEYNDQCFSGTCTNGLCVGKDEGAACSGGDCKYGYYCKNNGICTIYGDATSCSIDGLVSTNNYEGVMERESSCRPGYECNDNPVQTSIPYVCVMQCSLGIDAECQMNEVCDFGLACINNFCENIYTNITGCDYETNNCPAYSWCNCSDVQADSNCISTIQTGCCGYWSSVVTCSHVHNCYIGNFPGVTCLNRYCSEQLNEWYECINMSPWVHARVGWPSLTGVEEGSLTWMLWLLLLLWIPVGVFVLGMTVGISLIALKIIVSKLYNPKLKSSYEDSGTFK